MLVLATAWTTSAWSGQVAVPPELRGWEDWALQGQQAHRCPWLVPAKRPDTRICAWPSVLELQVDAHGARFSQRWQVATESWVPLPGSVDTWPEEVSIDNHPAALVLHDGEPALRVAPGIHNLAGTLHWTRRPEWLPLPSSVALVKLSVDGARVLSPQRNDGSVSLGARAFARQEDRVDVHVFRLLTDELPATLTTRVHLAIAGDAREIRLAAVLPAGFVPSAFEGPLAARLDPDNTLHVQVRPGVFTLTLEARGPSPVTEVKLGPSAAPWPAVEIWSFKAEDRLRVAAVEGVVAVDPVQANVPQEWRDLPAYRLNAGAALRVVERSRGLSALDANQLQLRRTAWLDFTGTGYTIVDSLSGEMRQGWRLDMAAPYALRSARTASGESLLVTQGMSTELTGLELREPHIDLVAVSRLERAGSLPATGWRARFAHASGELVMAPGYRLLAALGPDSAPQAWLERWRLLDIFAVLLIATVAGRVLGMRSALVALAAIALTYQEAGAPTWLWLAVLVALALQRAAPKGRLRNAAAALRLLALALLVIVLVPFAITQARLAIYPQLEALEPLPYGRNTEPSLQGQIMEEAKKAGRPAAAASAVTGSAPSAVAAVRMEEVVTSAARVSSVSRYEPGALVQAGPGLPAWRYHVYPYAWSGPIEETATVRFLVSPPWLTRLWRILDLVLSVLFLFDLVRNELPGVPRWWRGQPAAAMSALFLGVALSAIAPSRAFAASTPDPLLLEQLRSRLLAAPQCAPDCAEVLDARVTVAPARLSVLLNVSALDTVGVPLPGAGANWSPQEVQVDGAPAGWVHRSPRGIRYISLSPGRHAVRLEGPVGQVDAISLAFPMVPRVIDVEATGWDAGGVSERRLLSGALELVRRQPVKDTSDAPVRQEEFPPFVDVDRLFRLLHEWTIDTTVTRAAPKSAAFTISLPLLSAEAVTTAGLNASAGRVALGLAAGQDSLSFTSVLPRADTLELAAAAAPTYAEHWSFQVGATWHVDFSGVPPVMPEEDGATWTFEYYPRPGERLRLHVTRPEAAGGSTLAFDQVQLRTVVGKRSSDATLSLQYRSTQGGRETLRVPADARVTRVLSDGEPIGLRPEQGELSLSALPGTHTWVVDWESAHGAHLVTRAPPVDVSAAGQQPAAVGAVAGGSLGAVRTRARSGTDCPLLERVARVRHRGHAARPLRAHAAAHTGLVTAGTWVVHILMAGAGFVRPLHRSVPMARAPRAGRRFAALQPAAGGLGCPRSDRTAGGDRRGPAGTACPP